MTWFRLALLVLAVCLTGCPDDDMAQEACTTLGANGAITASLNTVPAEQRVLDGPAPQVLIEARFVAVDRSIFDTFGFDFNLTADVLTNGNGTLGAASGEPGDTVVDSQALGGPLNTWYLVPGNQPGNGFVGYVNFNFVQRFPTVQVFVQLPPVAEASQDNAENCVVFTDASTLPLENFPGLPNHQNLPAADQGFGGDTLHFSLLDEVDVQALLQALQADSRNTVLQVPAIQTYHGQRVVAMIDDHAPTLQQVEPEFAAVIIPTTSNPSGIFSGAALDLTPTVNQDGTIRMEIRFGTEALSFFYSTPFNVDQNPADLQVPVVRISRNVTNVTVPDGQTILLGGLQQQASQTVQNGVPGLSQLPLIGSFLQGKQTDAQQQDLIIFITPHILTTSSD